MNSNPDFALSFLLDPTTVVCIAAGIVIVALYSMQKFAEPTPEKGEDNFIAQLLPKYLATREEYSRALIWYMGSMVGVLCGPAFLTRCRPSRNLSRSRRLVLRCF